MIQTLTKNWWLLALCGVLDAILALMNLSMRNPDRSLSWGMFGLQNTAMDMCRLAVLAGALTIVAGVWRSRNGSAWFLVLNGLALGAYGLLPLVWRGPLGFRLFAGLIAVMAVSLGILELAISRTLRRVTDKWFPGVAGAGSVGFALGFLALALGWIKLESGPPWQGFLWLAAYFGFSALSKLGPALRLHRPGLSPSRQQEAVPPLGKSNGKKIQDTHIKQAAMAEGT